MNVTTTYRGHPVEYIDRDRDGNYLLIGPGDEIVAELKQHEFLSIPNLRTLRHGNGGHRRSRKTVYGGSTRQSRYAGAIGAYYFPGHITWVSFDEAPAKPIENAGIRAGEIIAHRGWRVCGDRLASIYKREHIWRPGSPMTGDVRGEYGVHAFKRAEMVERYCDYYFMQSIFQVVARVTDGGIEFVHDDSLFAIGQVALWGEVIEHERGYRAEFAKIVAVDRLIGGGSDSLLSDLRAQYVQ